MQYYDADVTGEEMIKIFTALFLVISSFAYCASEKEILSFVESEYDRMLECHRKFCEGKKEILQPDAWYFYTSGYMEACSVILDKYKEK